MFVSVATHANDIILVRRGFQTKVAKHLPWIFLTITIVAVLMLLAMLLWLLPEGENLWETIGRFFAENPRKLWEWMGMFAIIAAHSWIPYAQSRDKIVISSTGIAYKTSLPTWFPAILNSWNISWNRIKSAEIRLTMGIVQPTLVLNEGTRNRKILIDAWVNSEDKPKKLPLREMFQHLKTLRATSFEEMKARVEVSPLIQALRAHQVPVVYPDKTGTGMMFDLQSHPRTKVAVAVFLGLLTYAFVDTLSLDEIYIGDYPETIWAGAGLVSAILALPLIADPKIPRVVSFGLSAMIGLGVAVALYPGLLRLNQLTDSDGLVAHEYVLREYVRLVPVESGPPEITLNRYRDYFSQFPLGSPYRLYLRRGGLEFYQLDEGPLLEAARASYEKKSTEAREPRRR